MGVGETGCAVLYLKIDHLSPALFDPELPSLDNLHLVLIFVGVCFFVEKSSGSHILNGNCLPSLSSSCSWCCSSTFSSPRNGAVPSDSLAQFGVEPSLCFWRFELSTFPYIKILTRLRCDSYAIIALIWVFISVLAKVYQTSPVL